MVFFPDTTNHDISGKFIEKNGILVRDEPQVINSDRFYWWQKDPVIWIDPPGTVLQKIHLVTIESSLPEYKTKDSIKMDDYDISFGFGRYVDSSCTNARITAENWVFMTGDTLNFLKHDCDPKFTNFNSTKVLKFEKSYQDITTSYKYQLDKWIKDMKERCKVKGCV